MNKEEIIKEAKKLHEESEDYRDVYELLCKDIQLQESLESYLAFNSSAPE